LGGDLTLNGHYNEGAQFILTMTAKIKAKEIPKKQTPKVKKTVFTNMFGKKYKNE